MKQFYRLIVSFFLLCLASQSLMSQELRVVTEDFKVSKDSCKVYAYDLYAYLRTKGLFEGLAVPKDKKSDRVELVKKRLQINGTDFTKDYIFIVELKSVLGSNSEGEYFGDFTIVEIGFANKAKATEVFRRAKEASQKYRINMQLYIPQFKCLQIGNSVFFVYSVDPELWKFRDMAEGWEP